MNAAYRVHAFCHLPAYQRVLTMPFSSLTRDSYLTCAPKHIVDGWREERWIRKCDYYYTLHYVYLCIIIIHRPCCLNGNLLYLNVFFSSHYIQLYFFWFHSNISLFWAKNGIPTICVCVYSYIVTHIWCNIFASHLFTYC